MKETYLSRDFRETAAERFPTQAKELNTAFDARLNGLLAENVDASKEKLYHLKAFVASCSKSDTMRWQFRLPAYSCGFE